MRTAELLLLFRKTGLGICILLAGMLLMPGLSAQEKITRDANQKAGAELEKNAIPLTSWYGTGPFALPKEEEEPLSLSYSPEKAKFKQSAKFKDAQGGEAGWKTCDEKTPYVKAGSPAAIYYFVSVFTPKEDGTYFMRCPAAIMEITLAGKTIYTREKKNKTEIWDEDFPEIELKAGKKHFFRFKYVSDDKAAVFPPQIRLYTQNPEKIYRNVFLKETRSALFRENLNQKEKSALGWMCGRLYEQYEKDEDWENYFQWRLEQMRVFPQYELRQSTNSLLELYEKNPEQLKAIIRLLDQVRKTQLLDPGYPMYLLDRLLGKLFELNQLDDMVTVMDAEEVLLSKNQEMELKYRAQISGRRGSPEEGMDMLAEAIRKNPELGKSNALRSVRTSLEENIQYSMTIPVELEMATIRHDLKQAEAEKNPLLLFQLVRKTLEEHAMFYTEVEPGVLYSGASSAFFDLFKNVMPGLREEEKNYVNTLRTKLKLPEKELAHRAALFHTSVKSDVTGTDHGTPLFRQPKKLPKPAENFQPVWRGRPGFLEQLSALPLLTTARKPLPGSVVESANGWLFQNSRELSLLDLNGKVLWSRVQDLSSDRKSNSTAAAMRRKVECGIPQVRDGVIYTREFVNGTGAVSAIQEKSGKELWNYSEPNRLAVTDPLFWKQSILVLVREPGANFRFFLVYLDRATGKKDAEFELFNGTSLLSLGQRSIGISKNYYLPRPTVCGDIAYIDSGCGVLIAFDLLRQAPVWLRKYRSASFKGNQMTNAAEFRHATSPIAGINTVMFAPFDCLQPQILDRATGQMVTERSCFNWRYYAAGRPAENEFYEFTESGITRCSLKDGKKTAEAELPNARPLHSSFPNGELLVQSGRDLLRLDADLKVLQKVTLPEGFIVSAVSPETYLGWQEFSRDAAIGTLTKDTPKELAAQPSESDGIKGLPSINGTLWQTRGDRYLLTDDYFALPGENLNPVWAYAWDRRSMSLRNGKDVIFLSAWNALLMLDKKTGRIIQQYPAYGEKNPGRICWYSTTGNELYFLLELPEYKYSTHVLTADGPRTLLDKIPANGKILGLLNQGKTIFSHNYNKRRFEFREMDGKKNTLTVTAVSPIEGNLNSAVYPVSDNLILLKPFTGRSYQLVFGNGKVKNILCKTEVPHCHPGYFELLDTGRTISVSAGGRAQILSCEKVKDITGDSPWYGLPRISGDILYGTRPSAKNAAKLELLAMDQTTGRLLYAVEPPNVPTNRKKQKELRPGPSFVMDGVCYNFLVYREGFGQTGILVQRTQDPKSIKTRLFPSFANTKGGFGSRDSIEFFFENAKALRFGRDKLLSIWNESRKPWEVPETQKFNFNPDGYPDEWGEQTFHPSFDGKLEWAALTQKWGQAFFAVRIKDPKLVESLGIRGIPAKLGLATWSSASVNPGNLLENSYQTLFEGVPNNRECRFAYTVYPDGTAFLEFMMSRYVMKAANDGGSELSKATRQLVGDIHFELFRQNDDGTRSYLLSGEDYPLFFQTIRF